MTPPSIHITTQTSSRRTFLRQVGSTLVPLCYGLRLPAETAANLKPVCFGVCADVHKDLIPDAGERLQVFIGAANRERADFIVQLGDFCQLREKNRGFLQIWNQFAGPSPWELGMPEQRGTSRDRERLAPRISDRKIALDSRGA